MIIKRKSFSKSKYAETATQARDRETTAAKSVAGLGLLGAGIGGIIGAGLYGLNRKNLIKQNEEKNRRLAIRRERLAEKQKEN